MWRKSIKLASQTSEYRHILLNSTFYFVRANHERGEETLYTDKLLLPWQLPQNFAWVKLEGNV